MNLEWSKPGGAVSTWASLQHKLFRWLWLASIASNIGTWMQEVGAGWLMTSLSSSPLIVSLVQVAAAAPMFVLALPAGAMADIIDKRRYLLVVQSAIFPNLRWVDNCNAFACDDLPHGNWDGTDHASLVCVDARARAQE